MASKYRYRQPAPPADMVTYRYMGFEIDFPISGLCPDCRTPTVWVEDEDPARPYISMIYHDLTCPHVRSGTGEVAPEGN